jgi:AcrR family transcriptional regulator
LVERKKRRPRDPQATREAILDAASTLLASDGPEGLSLSEVARLAGVNRGTAYQHFETREDLIKATAERVSNRLFDAIFGETGMAGTQPEGGRFIIEQSDRLARFGMENPELCRIWLFEVLSSPDPSKDPFWKKYEESFARFTGTEPAQDGVDYQVMSVILLAGTVLWPVWARAHVQGDDERRRLADRFSREILRLSLYGTLKPEHFPEIVARLGEGE